jgi:hypothetical protein
VFADRKPGYYARARRRANHNPAIPRAETDRDPGSGTASSPVIVPVMPALVIVSGSVVVLPDTDGVTDKTLGKNTDCTLGPKPRRLAGPEHEKIPPESAQDPLVTIAPMISNDKLCYRLALPGSRTIGIALKSRKSAIV